MADRSVSVRLQADIGSYIAGMTRASAATGLLQGATASLMTGQGALAVIAGGAVVGGFAAAVSAAADFEKSMSGVQAATMASSGTMSQLRDAALQAGADTAYSASEAADAITEMAKAGVSAKDIMGGGLSGALNLAAAGQLDVADAAEIAATALSVFNLSGEQMPHVADLLAAGAGKAQGSVSDLSAALNQSALVAKNTGLSIEDTTGALALFASNGLLGSDAGTSFKTMLMSLNPRSEEAATLMDQLGLRAYDAQGKFVGLQAYAGQLKDGLAGLSEEQRNAALQTIFGSDAVRAASILYQAGSEGVQQWTRNVNDAGFASRQAAMLQDNLRGDLEKLGGAWDTLMIALGSGSQGVLRGVVQALTDVVDAGGDLIGFLASVPGEWLAAAAGIAAFLVLQGPLTAMWASMRVWANASILSPLIVGFANLLTGTVSLTGALGSARVALTGFLTTAAPFVAIAAISAGVVSILNADKAAKDARESIEALMAPVENSTSNVERLQAQADAIDGLREQAESAASALDQYNGRSLLEKIWDWGSPDDPGAALQQAAEESETALQDMQDAADAAGDAISAMAAKYGMSRDEVIAFADANNIDLTSGLNNVTTQFTRYAGAMSETEQVQAGLTQETAKYTDQVSAAKQAIDEYVAGLSLLNGDHLTAMEAERQWAAALMDAQTALDGLDGSVIGADGNLNLYSDAGNQAADTLRGLRESADQVIGTMTAQGASAADAAAKDAQLRNSFYLTALQMTGSEDAAARLTDQIYGIPADRQTRITAQVGQATADVAALQGQIDGLRGRTITINVRSVKEDLDGVAVSGNGRMGTYWTGGYTGDGGKYDVAGIVHRGELVVPKDDVDRIGLGNLQEGIGAMLKNPGPPQEYAAMPREMGWLPAMSGSSSTSSSRSTTIQVATVENADRIARVAAQAMRDDEFLAGV